jgi:hypothetical protein
MGLELNHDNTMIIKDAFWTIGGIATNDKDALPEWRVVGKEQGGQDPLAYILANPYDESLLIDSLIFLLPSNNTPLSLDDLGNPFSGTLGSLIPIGSFSLAPHGTQGDTAEFLFDGGALPLLNPGAVLAAEFSAGFAGMDVNDYVIVRTQHVPEPTSISLLASGLIVFLRRSASRRHRSKRVRPLNLPPIH